MIVIPIIILFIDFATGLCENPRQQGLVGLSGSEASLLASRRRQKMEYIQKRPEAVSVVGRFPTQAELA
jgi:hypothetical protein